MQLSAVPSLDDVATWRRVLVLAPHPDDESLATGGLLQRAVARGAAIRVVFATDGENNPWPQRVLERRWRLGSAERVRWGARRRAEALAALATLGVPASSATFLHLPDQGLTPLLLRGDASTVALLASEIAAARPTLVVAPSVCDRHRDHAALAVLLRLALARPTPFAHRHTEVAYVVHGDPVAWDWSRIALTPAELARKRAAIHCHASQTALSRHRFLSYAQSTERFLDPALASATHRVRHAVVHGAEVLLVLAPGARALPATLDVLAVGHDGSVASRSMRLGPGSRSVRVRLPVPPARLFVRLERPRLFFDRAGWRSFALPHAGDSAMHGVELPSPPVRSRSVPGAARG